MFGVPTGDCLLRGVAELYTGLVGDQGICGHFNADRFACLLKRQACYTDTLFLRFGAQVNTLSNAKNVIMKWGIYPVTDPDAAGGAYVRPRALLAAAASGASMGSISRATTTLCAVPFCGSRPLRTAWRRRLPRISSRSICSPNTTSRTTGWPGRRHWSAGSTRNGAFCCRRSSSLCLKKMVLLPSWTSMCGTRSVPYCRRGAARAGYRFPSRSMYHGPMCIRRI